MRRLAVPLLSVLVLSACSVDAGPEAPATQAASTSASAASEASSSAPPMGRSPIDGRYRTTITVADGVAAGLSRRQADQIDGELETSFSLGVVRQFIVSGVTADGFMGTFAVDGSSVILTDYDGRSITLEYRLRGGELTFTTVEPPEGLGETLDAVVWTSHPWT